MITNKNVLTTNDIFYITGKKNASLTDAHKTVLNDYELAVLSRQISILSRKEVLTGKAKFGIIGDGKELPQIALAKNFEKGDFRAGYYRDQTWMLACKSVTPQQLFAQLYAHADKAHDPNSMGRQMNAHFSNLLFDENGNFTQHTAQKNTSSDISCTAGQMSRAVGLAFASKKYRELQNTLPNSYQFSNNGNEVCFVAIGDASTSEGVFWEAMNAACVLKIPMAVSVWDDGYGISVPIEYQTTKGSISKALAGFEYSEKEGGMLIAKVLGHDYLALCKTYQQVSEIVRKKHIPALIHVQELTQPQGHSTSGSHERYKDKERLNFEKEFDCIKKFKEWILQYDIATIEQLQIIEENAKNKAREAMNLAWKEFNIPINNDLQQIFQIFDTINTSVQANTILEKIKLDISALINPLKKDIPKYVLKAILELQSIPNINISPLINFLTNFNQNHHQLYSTYLYNQTPTSAFNVTPIPPKFSENSPIVDGHKVINTCFDVMLARDPRVLAFGEDVGKIGDVNQGFAGLQDKYDEKRVFDVGIRENTIIGQGIGLSMRGFRPIAEIQYLDYLLYALQVISDDLACLYYRSAGNQIAPLIIRTRGHRLEGIWHSGSPMGMILTTCKGIHLLVPRNMTQAAGFYNTLLKANDPAIVVECLNGYRQKEKLPDNIGEFCLPIGQPEILMQGVDITIVTYGSCCKIVIEAATLLKAININCEVIDVQSLMPFDVNKSIVQSIQKTNRLLIVDEDVPGGASAFILQQLIEEQNAYKWLDSKPTTITALPNRPAFGSDGDYFCKPNVEQVFLKVYQLMQEVNPNLFNLPLFS